MKSINWFWLTLGLGKPLKNTIVIMFILAWFNWSHWLPGYFVRHIPPFTLFECKLPVAVSVHFELRVGFVGVCSESERRISNIKRLFECRNGKIAVHTAKNMGLLRFLLFANDTGSARSVRACTVKLRLGPRERHGAIKPTDREPFRDDRSRCAPNDSDKVLDGDN